MKINQTIIFLIFTVFYINLSAQNGKTIRYSSSYSMFPDLVRSKGHNYQGKHYDALTHYSDSSILIYIPTGFTSKGKINLVFWFHGWGNMIDSACKQFELISQFEQSGRDAIFIFPQGPKNAPDSYGGKLEQPDIFQLLINEVVSKLYENKVIQYKNNFNLTDYAISLAGHSGAYRVISKIISHNPVKEVILFDAMYGENVSYLDWLSATNHRFINIYTKNGGTYDNSHFVFEKLRDSLHLPVISLEENAISDSILKSHLKIFIFSKMGHNEVITHNYNLALFLRHIPNK